MRFNIKIQFYEKKLLCNSLKISIFALEYTTKFLPRFWAVAFKIGKISPTNPTFGWTPSVGFFLCPFC